MTVRPWWHAGQLVDLPGRDGGASARKLALFFTSATSPSWRGCETTGSCPGLLLRPRAGPQGQGGGRAAAGHRPRGLAGLPHSGRADRTRPGQAAMRGRPHFARLAKALTSTAGLRPALSRRRPDEGGGWKGYERRPWGGGRTTIRGRAARPRPIAGVTRAISMGLLRRRRSARP